MLCAYLQNGCFRSKWFHATQIFPQNSVITLTCIVLPCLFHIVLVLFQFDSPNDTLYKVELGNVCVGWACSVPRAHSHVQWLRHTKLENNCAVKGGFAWPRLISHTLRCWMRTITSQESEENPRDWHHYSVTLQLYRQGSQLDSLLCSHATNTELLLSPRLCPQPADR